jgi:hypothetical protein
MRWLFLISDLKQGFVSSPLEAWSGACLAADTLDFPGSLTQEHLPFMTRSRVVVKFDHYQKPTYLDESGITMK